MSRTAVFLCVLLVGCGAPFGSSLTEEPGGSAGTVGIGAGSAAAGGEGSATGGAPAMGGAPETGGTSSAGAGGSDPATGGGSAAGAASTGGAAGSGGSATGGAATGGASTGGTSTGGMASTGGASTGGASTGGTSGCVSAGSYYLTDLPVRENSCITIPFTADQSWRTTVLLKATDGAMPLLFTYKNCDHTGSLNLQSLNASVTIGVDPTCSLTVTFMGDSSPLTVVWQ